MTYRILGNKAVRSTDTQVGIRLVKESMGVRETEGYTLYGGWVRTIDLIRDIREQGVVITAKDVKDLSNACSLSISPCGSFIRLASRIDNVTCNKVEEDSIWFSKEFSNEWITPQMVYGKSVKYIEVVPYVDGEFDKEVVGRELYRNVIPILNRGGVNLVPIPKQLRE